MQARREITLPNEGEETTREIKYCAWEYLIKRLTIQWEKIWIKSDIFQNLLKIKEGTVFSIWRKIDFLNLLIILDFFKNSESLNFSNKM
jgi:hypothetical protein